MAPPAGELNGELTDVNGCLQGDPEALGRLREKCHSSVLAILISRGASKTEAEDLLADLWSDCVPGADDKPSLLEKFSGKSKLLGWLSTVATRRWIDFKRRQMRTATPSNQGENNDLPDDAAAEARLPTDDALVEILRHSLQNAFASCPAETLILLQLRYMHNLSQRELVRMVGYHESKISRMLSSSMEDIRTATLAEIRKSDPWLQLSWEDLLDLCDSLGTGFF